MARLEVSWTKNALRQRNHVLEYWNIRNRSKTYSRKLNLKIKERLEIIKENPEIGKKTNHTNIRAISLAHYAILYRIAAQKLIIIAFWDNRQDPAKLLDILKTTDGDRNS